MPDDEETGEHAEGHGGHGEEIHSCDDLAVILKERLPRLLPPRIAGSFPHPSQDRALGDVEAEHLQLAVDARRTQAGFSAIILKINAPSSLLVGMRPMRLCRRESQVQYSLNPALCQCSTVSGWTRTKASFHSGQMRRNRIQKSRSVA
jgi:hypothetical protein